MSVVENAPRPVQSALDTAVDGLLEIVVEDLEPGQSLPPEGELAAQLGVSRLTVREALKVLSGRGLVGLGKGRRPVVRTQDSAVLSDYFAVALRRDPRGFLELNDIRRSLEVLSASAAARAASTAGLKAIDFAVQRMSAAASDEARDESQLERYHQADLDFHEALALASGNRLLALLLESLADCLHESFAASAAGHFERGGTMQDVVEAHRRIADAVRSGDPKLASKAMLDHLDEAERDLRASPRRDADQ
jgi:GntR family transcriptional repressor for pyruvate dehydrogenase complex